MKAHLRGDLAVGAHRVAYAPYAVLFSQATRRSTRLLRFYILKTFFARRAQARPVWRTEFERFLGDRPTRRVRELFTTAGCLSKLRDAENGVATVYMVPDSLWLGRRSPLLHHP
jgi:hypothetical protein